MVDGERQRRFEALLRERQRIVLKVANVYARNPHDREDLAQDIVAQLWRSLTLRPTGNEKTGAIRIAPVR